MKKLILGLAIALITANAAQANSSDNYSKPQHHAPIGVMADHLHSKGEFMLSYRHSTMKMAGNRAGTNRVSVADIRAEGFMMVPTEMDMKMHMFGAMYGLTDDITLMLGTSYIEKEMIINTPMGDRFSFSNGLGDTKLSALIKLIDNIHANAGISLPTGSIDEELNGMRLPYPMQLGSGTFDPILSLTYNGHSCDRFSYGAQVSTALRFGENSEDYRLGNEYSATAWAAYQIIEPVSLSLRLDAKKIENIEGADTNLNPMMTPTARADCRGGERIDLSFGANFSMPTKAFPAGRLAIEFIKPLHQDLDGYQLETDERVIIAYQTTF